MLSLGCFVHLRGPWWCNQWHDNGFHHVPLTTTHLNNELLAPTDWLVSPDSHCIFLVFLRVCCAEIYFVVGYLLEISSLGITPSRTYSLGHISLGYILLEIWYLNIVLEMLLEDVTRRYITVITRIKHARKYFGNMCRKYSWEIWKSLYLGALLGKSIQVARVL